MSIICGACVAKSNPVIAPDAVAPYVAALVDATLRGGLVEFVDELCPTHRRLFDRCIEYGRKVKAGALEQPS